MRYSRVMEFLKYKGWITWMLPIVENKQKEDEEKKMRYFRLMEFLKHKGWITKMLPIAGRTELKTLE